MIITVLIQTQRKLTSIIMLIALMATVEIYRVIRNNIMLDGTFGSGILAPAAAATFDHTFTEAGKYPYFCLLHPNMVRTVSVVS